MTETRILQNFINTHSKNNVAQGSTEWHEKRKRVIGGSEIAKIVGSDEYGDVVDIIKSKLELNKF